MDNELFWTRTESDGTVVVGLTDAAFDLFGQLWSIIPVNDRKRNYGIGESVVAVEGSDSLGTLEVPFNVKRLAWYGSALERPDQLTTQTPLFSAEVTS